MYPTITLREKELLATAGMDALVGCGSSSNSSSCSRCNSSVVHRLHNQHRQWNRDRSLWSLHHDYSICILSPKQHAHRYAYGSCTLQMFERLIVFGLQFFGPVTTICCSVCECVILGSAPGSMQQLCLQQRNCRLPAVIAVKRHKQQLCGLIR